MTRGLDKARRRRYRRSTPCPPMSDPPRPVRSSAPADPNNAGALGQRSGHLTIVINSTPMPSRPIEKLPRNGKTPSGSAAASSNWKNRSPQQAALKAAEISPDAKTYALLIGVSKYQKLPQDLWLQYADADAKTFSDHTGQPARRRRSARKHGGAHQRAGHHSGRPQRFPDFPEKPRGYEGHHFHPVAGHGSWIAAAHSS